ncbi:MAG: hypothetical protein AB8B67_02480 [Rickettsiaceae bacterium]
MKTNLYNPILSPELPSSELQENIERRQKSLYSPEKAQENNSCKKGRAKSAGILSELRDFTYNTDNANLG